MAVFSWSKSERRYYRDSEAVSDELLDDWVRTTVDNAAIRIRAFSQDYVDGKINHAEWVIRMRDELKNGIRGVTQLANGGKLTASQIGQMANVVKAQYGYLNAFSLAIENGSVLLGSGLVARAQMYAEGLWAHYQNAVVLRERKAGAKEARLVRGGGKRESCEECIADAAMGWVDADKLAPIGSRKCVSRCRCRIETRTK